MRNVYDNITQTIGNTPIVKLNKLSSAFKANVYVKVEYMNPGASVKDRIAIQIINDAEASGELKPGGTIIEATSGNTGAGLAMTAAVRGYQCICVLPDKQSEEKRNVLRGYGAKVVVTPTNVEADDPRSYYKVAARLVEETENSFYANQYHNPSNPKTHYLSTGPEMWEQLEGNIDVFVAGLGTGGTITGVGKYLKEQKPDVQIVGVDPIGSLYYDYFKTGKLTEAFSYVLEGIGEDFLPSTCDLNYVDEIVRVNDAECFTMTRRLAREEGIFAGGSCGAAIAGALHYLEKHDREGLNVLILLPDSGSRYLSKIFNDQWMADNGYLEDAVSLGKVGHVIDALNSSGVITVQHDLSLSGAINLMKEHGISQLPVMRDGKIQGVLREKTLLEAALEGHTGKTAGDLAGNDYCTVDRATSVRDVSEMLRKVRVALVLNEGGELTSVLTRIDLIDHVSRATTPPA